MEFYSLHEVVDDFAQEKLHGKSFTEFLLNIFCEKNFREILYLGPLFCRIASIIIVIIRPYRSVS